MRSRLLVDDDAWHVTAERPAPRNNRAAWDGERSIRSARVRLLQGFELGSAKDARTVAFSGWPEIGCHEHSTIAATGVRYHGLARRPACKGQLSVGRPERSVANARKKENFGGDECF